MANEIKENKDYVSKELTELKWWEKIFGVFHGMPGRPARGFPQWAIHEGVVNSWVTFPEVQIGDITEYSDVLKWDVAYRIKANIVGTGELLVVPFATREDAYEYLINNIQDKNYIDVISKGEAVVDAPIDIEKIEQDLKAKIKAEVDAEEDIIDAEFEKEKEEKKEEKKEDEDTKETK